MYVYEYHTLSHPDIYSAISDAGSDTSSIHDPLIDYGSTPGGQGDGSLDREKAEGEVTLRDMSVSSFLDEVSMAVYCNVSGIKISISDESYAFIPVNHFFYWKRH